MPAPRYQTGRPVGRPGDYETKVQPHLELIAGWSKNGVAAYKIAENLGINDKTLSTYRHKYPELAEALKKGKEEADMQVVNAMHRAAVGYWIEEQIVTPKGDVVVTKKWIAPNPTLAIFWAKNRMPDEWRDKREVVQDVGSNLARLIEESMSRQEEREVIDVTPRDPAEDGAES